MEDIAGSSTEGSSMAGQESAKQDHASQTSTDTIREDWQHGKSITGSLLYLYENKMWTDVSFRCKDHDVDNLDDRIKAHKMILAARSPVFKAMFYGPCSDGKEEQELLSMEAKIFHLAVKYMYTDDTDLTKADVFKVLEIGHMYQISGLVDFCANFVKGIVNPQNAVEILELAMFYDLEELKDSACEVIDDKAEQVLSSERFLQTSEACMTYILKGDTLFEEEAAIIRAAEHWAENKIKRKSCENLGRDIRKTLDQAFYYLRVPTLKVYDFSKFIKGKGYYSMEEVEDLLEHIGDHKDVPQVACHSAIKRVPRFEKLTVPQVQNYGTDYVCKVMCKLLLRVTRDCVIKRIQLSEIKYSVEYSSRKRLELRSDIPCVCLTGSLCIDKQFKTEINHLVPPDNWYVNLANPVKLRARDLPYTLQLELQLDDRYSVFFMTICKNPRRPSYYSREEKCKGVFHSEECLEFCNRATERATIRFVYCKESEFVNLVQFVEVCNEGNRNA